MYTTLCIIVVVERKMISIECLNMSSNQRESQEAITKELVTILEEMKTLNERLADATEKMKDVVTMKQQQILPIDQESNVFEQYILKYGGSSRVLDKYVFIQRVGDNRYEMGTKTVEIDEDSHILVGGVKYDGLTGLWTLVMMNDPPESRDTPNDLHMYEDLVYRTKVVLGKGRYKKTKKWIHIFPLFKTLAEDGNANHHVGDDDDAAFHDSFQHASWLNKNNDGDGIQFLPSDIKGLETKMNYLLAEYRAGNRSSLTRNQIVPILDELLRRKRISRKEYRDINIFLQGKLCWRIGKIFRIWNVQCYRPTVIL